MKISILAVFAITILGCNKQSKNSELSYLSDEMNGKTTLPTYKLRALEYTNSITGKSSPVASKRVGSKHWLVLAQHSHVIFHEDYIDLYVHFTVESGGVPTWTEESSLEERKAVGDELCKAHIRRLADYLDCEFSAIEARWTCDADSDGRVSGKSIESKTGLEPAKK